MNRILVATLLGGLAFTAAAQQSPSPTAEPHELRAADVRNDDAVRAHPFCLQETGSHITKAHNDRVYSQARRGQAHADPVCDDGNGRVYSRRDIERTGASNMADALRMLDPSIH